MAGKSNPSIYDDRTTIGSADELDEYGVWVKSEPQVLNNSVPEIEELPEFDDVLNDNMELPDFDSALGGDLEVVEEENMNDPASFEFEEIPENSDLPEGPAPTSIDQDGFTEVSMSDFLDSPPDQHSQESIDFGNLDSTIPEIEPIESPIKSQDFGTHSSETKDLSTQLLQRIADELSSIKKEISSLKTELSVVRGEIKSTESADSKGFFDEEDDEKIALTGDELDNILNTANFTEETGSGEETDISLDTGTQDLNKTDDAVEINFDEELSELDGAIKVEDEIKSSDSDDYEIALDLSPEFNEEPSELNMLREEGAQPMTEAPDDITYLESDPLANDNIDLSDAVIDEPDLSSGITENPVSEPAIDNISIDLDMEEAILEGDSGSDDFVFETEDTTELPLTELPEIDEAISVIDSSEEELLPETNLIEPLPKGQHEPEPAVSDEDGIPNNLKQELKIVLSYMDQLLESLPEEKIEEFAQSEYFDTYKKLFEELGLI